MWPHDVVASLCSPFSESSASLRLSPTSLVYTIDPSATGLANASYPFVCWIFDQDADVSSVWVFKQAKWPWKEVFSWFLIRRKKGRDVLLWLNNIGTEIRYDQGVSGERLNAHVNRYCSALELCWARRNWGKYVTEIAARCILEGNRLVRELLSCLFLKPTRGRSDHLFSKLSYIWAPQIFVCHVLKVKICPNLSFKYKIWIIYLFAALPTMQHLKYIFYFDFAFGWLNAELCLHITFEEPSNKNNWCCKARINPNLWVIFQLWWQFQYTSF